MKKWIYWILIVFGALLAAIPLLELLFECSEECSLIFSLISMIGGGVFCSAIVSYLIEVQQEKRAKKQREHLLEAIKHGFFRLCERELFQLSNYHSKYVLEKKPTYHHISLTVESACSKICNLLSNIEKCENSRFAGEEIIITKEILELDKMKRYHLAAANQPYYQSLLTSLTSLSSDFAVFLSSEILSREDIDYLKLMISDIQDIIAFSSEFNLDEGIVIAYKKIFFEKGNEIIAALNLPKYTTTEFHYYEPIE